eukprot:5251400-Amphidinium_carterae.3
MAYAGPAGHHTCLATQVDNRYLDLTSGRRRVGQRAEQRQRQRTHQASQNLGEPAGLDGCRSLIKWDSAKALLTEVAQKRPDFAGLGLSTQDLRHLNKYSSKPFTVNETSALAVL